jgi:hypothetical protein
VPLRLERIDTYQPTHQMIIRRTGELRFDIALD